MSQTKTKQRWSKILAALTLEEKCALLSGAETFKTRAMPRHGIPALWLSDGPHGVRKQAGESDHLGLNPSEPATCFPTAAAVANSWDPALGEAIGQALGEEAAAQGVGVLLGPGLNIQRNVFFGGPLAFRQDGGGLYPGHSVPGDRGLSQAFRRQQPGNPADGLRFGSG